MTTAASPFPPVVDPTSDLLSNLILYDHSPLVALLRSLLARVDNQQHETEALQSQLAAQAEARALWEAGWQQQRREDRERDRQDRQQRDDDIRQQLEASLKRAEETERLQRDNQSQQAALSAAPQRADGAAEDGAARDSERRTQAEQDAEARAEEKERARDDRLRGLQEQLDQLRQTVTALSQPAPPQSAPSAAPFDLASSPLFADLQDAVLSVPSSLSSIREQLTSLREGLEDELHDERTESERREDDMRRDLDDVRTALRDAIAAAGANNRESESDEERRERERREDEWREEERRRHEEAERRRDERERRERDEKEQRERREREQREAERHERQLADDSRQPAEADRSEQERRQRDELAAAVAAAQSQLSAVQLSLTALDNRCGAVELSVLQLRAASFTAAVAAAPPPPQSDAPTPPHSPSPGAVTVSAAAVSHPPAIVQSAASSLPILPSLPLVSSSPVAPSFGTLDDAEFNRLLDSSQQLASVREQLSRLQQQLTDDRAAAARAQSRHGTAEDDGLRSTVASLSEQQGTLSVTIDRLRSKLHAVQSQLAASVPSSSPSSSSPVLSRASSSLDAVFASLKQLRADCFDMSSQLAALKAELSARKQADEEDRQRRDGLVAVVQLVQRELIERVEAVKQSSRAHADAAASRVRDELHAVKDDVERGVQAEVQRVEKGVQQLVSSWQPAADTSETSIGRFVRCVSCDRDVNTITGPASAAFQHKHGASSTPTLSIGTALPGLWQDSKDKRMVIDKGRELFLAADGGVWRGREQGAVMLLDGDKSRMASFSVHYDKLPLIATTSMTATQRTRADDEKEQLAPAGRPDERGGAAASGSSRADSKRGSKSGTSVL